MVPTILIKPFRQLSEVEKKGVFDFLYTIFGESYNEMVWPTDDWVTQAYLQDQLVTLVEIIERTVRVGDLDVKVGGVGGVGTLPEYRRRGYASLALKETGRFLHENLKVSFGLLLTNEKLEPFYRNLGWRRIIAPVAFDQPGVKISANGVTMFLPCAEETWPPGPVDLCGYPW